MAEIRNYNPVTKEAGHCIAVARASVGIYFALCGEQFDVGKKVIVPANLCYAGIYPVIYAGLEPVFCDVDPISGNVTLESFCEVYSENVVAAIVPHMYGNPVEELPAIDYFCKNNNILLIEDCASAMGATAAHYKLGAVGDYVVYSTGYSKTLDLGFGGFLFSSTRDLSFTEELEQELPMLCEQNEQNMAFFSKLYRLMRNDGSGTAIEAMICRGLASCCKNDYLHRIDADKKNWLFSQLEKLPQVIKDRRDALRFYEVALEKCELLRYPYTEGAVPWRFNILIAGNIRKEIIKKCLTASLPVSDWYPQVTNLFDVSEEFAGAQKHESMILNFPLLIEDEKRNQICKIIEETIVPLKMEV